VHSALRNELTKIIVPQSADSAGAPNANGHLERSELPQRTKNSVRLSLLFQRGSCFQVSEKEVPRRGDGNRQRCFFAATGTFQIASSSFAVNNTSFSERQMTKFKLMTAAAVVAGLTVPAAAQATFYIVQDTKTKRCTVVKERPTAKTMVIVGDSGKVYTTESEAQAAVRTIKVCETR
jgi:hypothetical protein